MGGGRIASARPPSVEGPLWGKGLQLPQLRRACVGKDSSLRIHSVPICYAFDGDSLHAHLNFHEQD
jgi:hypothetical protein